MFISASGLVARLLRAAHGTRFSVMEHHSFKELETHSLKGKFMKKLCILIVSCLLIEQAENPHTANAQGSFQDLDFESAILSPIPVNEVLYYVRITSALPGWSAYLGTTPDTQILQNDYTLGEASVDIFGPGNNSGGIGSINGIINGNYSLMLQAGGTPTELGARR